jgi:hypothetical protein
MGKAKGAADGGTEHGSAKAGWKLVLEGRATLHVCSLVSTSGDPSS